MCLWNGRRERIEKERKNPQKLNEKINSTYFSLFTLSVSQRKIVKGSARAGQIFCARPKLSNPAHSKSKRTAKTGWAGHTGQHEWFGMGKSGSVHFLLLGPAKSVVDRPNIYIIIIN